LVDVTAPTPQVFYIN